MGCSGSKEARRDMEVEGRPSAAARAKAAGDKAAADLAAVPSPRSSSPRAATPPTTKAKAKVKVAAPEEDDGEGGGRLKFKTETLGVNPPSTYNKAAQPRKPLLKSSSYLGTQLLALAKEHPALQPVAFLMGAVAAYALTARNLKLDCARIAKLVEQVESALVKLGSAAGKQLGALASLQATLDDAMVTLAVLRKPKVNGQSPKEVAEIASSGQLPKIRDRLKEALEELEGSSWLASDEMSIITKAKFTESKLVPASFPLVGSWNGEDSSCSAAAVTVSSTGMATTAADAAELAGAGSSALLAVEPRSASAASLTDILLDEEDVQGLLDPSIGGYWGTEEEEAALHQQQSAAAAAGSAHYQPMMMSSAFAMFDDPGPLPEEPDRDSDLFNGLMHAQVRQMCVLMDTAGLRPAVTLQRYPLDPSGEAQRLAYVLKQQLPQIVKKVDVSDIVEQLQAHFKAAYAAAYVVGNHSNYLLHCRVDGAMMGKEPGSVQTQSGRVQARKFSLCQHTVASTERVVHVPLENLPQCFDGGMFANAALCAVDEGVADQARRLGTPGTDPLIDEFVALVQKGGELIASGLQIMHTGSTILMDGHKVGTICLLHPPGEGSDEVLLELADKIAQRLSAAADTDTQEADA